MIGTIFLLVIFIIMATYYHWKEEYKEAIYNLVWANMFLILLIFSKIMEYIS